MCHRAEHQWSQHVLSEIDERGVRGCFVRTRHGRLEPAVVIACRDDRIVPAGQSRHVAELLGVEYVELPGASHAPFIERTDDCIRTIRRVLDR